MLVNRFFHVEIDKTYMIIIRYKHFHCILTCVTKVMTSWMCEMGHLDEGSMTSYGNIWKILYISRTLWICIRLCRSLDFRCRFVSCPKFHVEKCEFIEKIPIRQKGSRWRQRSTKFLLWIPYRLLHAKKVQKSSW